MVAKNIFVTSPEMIIYAYKRKNYTADFILFFTKRCITDI